MNLVVGVDWGTRKHMCVVLDASTGDVLDEQEFDHQGPALAKLCDWLLKQADGAPVQVGIERPHGVIVDVLLGHGFEVYAWNPKQTDAWRGVQSNSGAKDDRRDAFAIADALRVRVDFFRRLPPAGAQVNALREVLATIEALTHDLVALKNRLWSKLQSAFPSLWPLLKLDTQWTFKLLEKLLRSAAPWRIQRATIQATLHGVRTVDADTIKSALATDQTTMTTPSGQSAQLIARNLLGVFSAIAGARKALQDQRDELLASWLADQDEDTQRDARIIRSMPGAGAKLVSLLVAYCWYCVQDRDLRHLRLLAGVAPVTKQTGGRGRAHRSEVEMRRGCNKALRNAFHHWAQTAILRDEKSRQRLAELRARGHSKGRAYRQLCDGLLRVLAATLKAGVTYDPSVGTPGPQAVQMEVATP